MRQSAARHSSFLLFGLAALSSSCGWEALGESLLVPDDMLLTGPGKQIVEGNYRGLGTLDSREEGARVVAFRMDDDGPTVVIADLISETSCDAGKAQVYGPITDGDYWPDTVSVAMLDGADDDGFGTLRIVDKDCNLLVGPVEDVELPRYEFGDQVAVRDRAGTLTLHSLVGDATKKVADEVLGYRVSHPHLLALSSGVLTSYDADVAVEWKREGIDTLHAGGDGDDLVFSGAAGLYHYVVQHVGGEPRIAQLAEDFCQVMYNGSILGFFSPCAERKLNVEMSLAALDPGLAGGGTGDDWIVLSGPENVVPFSDGRLVESYTPGSIAGTAFAYIVGETADAEEGTVHVFDPTQETVQLAEIESMSDTLRAELVAWETSPSATRFVSRGFFRDWDGESGTYFAPETGGGLSLSKVADDVTQYFGSPLEPYGLRRIDDKGAYFSLLDADQEPQGRLDGAGTGVFRVSGEPMVGVVVDDEDGLGALHLADIETGTIGKKAVVDGVRTSSVRTLTDPIGFAYYADSTEGPGDLRVYLAEAGLESPINTGVSDFYWSYALNGIVYLIEEGDDAGVWLARGR